jgi:hypothetical protein
MVYSPVENMRKIPGKLEKLGKFGQNRRTRKIREIRKSSRNNRSSFRPCTKYRDSRFDTESDPLPLRSLRAVIYATVNNHYSSLLRSSGRPTRDDGAGPRIIEFVWQYHYTCPESLQQVVTVWQRYGNGMATEGKYHEFNRVTWGNATAELPERTRTPQ